MINHRSTDYACREGRGPVLLIANTFRMGGHATHDEREARATLDSTLFSYWGKRDPIGVYETFLIQGTLDLESGRRLKRTDSLREKNVAVLQGLEQRVTDEIDQAGTQALESARFNMPQPESAGEGVYGEPSNFESAVAAS